MKSMCGFSAMIAPGLCAVLGLTGCIGAPVAVRPSCNISWDKSADWRIAEYRVTAELIQENDQVQKVTHTVKAPATQVSCQELGTQAEGVWRVKIEACLEDKICSAPSKPMSFKVVNR